MFNNKFQSMRNSFQSLVHASNITLFEFRDKSKSAISNVVTAIKHFHEDEFLDALEILAENKILADNIAAKSKILADESNQLCCLAKLAVGKHARESYNMATNKKLGCEIQKYLKF